MDDTGTHVQAVLGGVGREGLLLAGGLAAGIGLPLVLLAAAVSGALQRGGPAAPGHAPDDIPPDHLAVMQRVSRETGIPWQVLAAIAKVESDFGRNMATSSAGAIGYGQFLPSSWAAFGQGGDPYDYRDVIPAMARYLLAHGAPGDLRRAVYAYNHSWEYVDQVLALATAFGQGTSGGPGLAESVVDTEPERMVARVVVVARAQLGKPYLFGAAGPDAFDCSGLVQWVLRQVGISAPRSAQSQYNWARTVPMTEVRVADLVFFHSTYPSPDYITHVGIYVGSGQMIVAPRTGEAVRLESLADPYWRAHFAGVGRLPFPGDGGGQVLALQYQREAGL
jgi:hypothetical protein